MNQKIKNWKDKRIWIIGASTGIGKALSLELLKSGSYLYLSSRKENLLNDIVQQYPNQSKALPLDVLDQVQIRESFKKIEDLDLVIFLAADYSPIEPENFPIETVHKIIEVNINGAMNITDIVLPYFIKKRSGHISYTASIAGYIGLPKSSVYGATKAFLINFAESLYGDVKQYNVDVSIINPGFVKTQLTAKNDFEMPFIMTPVEASLEIKKGFEDGRFDIVFPKAFSLFFRFLRILPYSLHLKLAKTLIKT